MSTAPLEAICVIADNLPTFADLWHGHGTFHFNYPSQTRLLRDAADIARALEVAGFKIVPIDTKDRSNG